MNTNDMPHPLKELVSTFRVKHIPRGQILLYQGDHPHEVYFLQSGIIKTHNIDDQGNEKILHLLKPYAVVPLVFFSGENTPTKWFYTALVDCEVSITTIDVLRKAMQDNSSVAIYLMNWFSREMHELLVRLDSLGKTHVKDKLLAALRFLAVCHGAKTKSDSWVRVPFPVNHQLLADMTGVTRESAAVVMKELTDKKMARNPKLTVLELNFEKVCGTDS